MHQPCQPGAELHASTQNLQPETLPPTVSPPLPPRDPLGPLSCPPGTVTLRMGESLAGISGLGPLLLRVGKPPGVRGPQGPVRVILFYWEASSSVAPDRSAPRGAIPPVAVQSLAAFITSLGGGTLISSLSITEPVANWLPILMQFPKPDL